MTTPTTANTPSSTTPTKPVTAAKLPRTASETMTGIMTGPRTVVARLSHGVMARPTAQDTRPAMASTHIIEYGRAGCDLSSVGPGWTPRMVRAAMKITMPTPDGRPSATAGTTDPTSLASDDPSAEATPAGSPVPNRLPLRETWRPRL